MAACRPSLTASLLPIAVLTAATFSVYAVTFFGHQFIANWDDYSYVLKNETVRGFTPSHIQAAFTAFYAGNYAPVHIMSYMLDYTLWGFNPSGYLFANVLLHATNGSLLFLIFQRLGLNRTVAFGAAGLFLLHPVQVESVAWISQRKNVLAMLFFLAAFHQYIRYRTEPGAGRRVYLTSLMCLTLGLLTKSVTVIFPAIALLYDLCLSPDRRPRWRAQIPVLAAAAGVALLALVSQAEEAGGGRRGYPGGSPLTALYSVLPVVIDYLKDCVAPFDLSPYYMIPIRKEPDLQVLLAAVAVSVFVAGLIRLYRRNRRLFFFAAFFMIALLPVLQIVPIIPLKNDRYLYFPLTGFAGFVAEISTLLRPAPGKYQTALKVAAMLLLAVMAVMSHRQALIWKNDITLWKHALRLDPDNQVAWLLLMKGYALRGDREGQKEARVRYDLLTARLGAPRGWEQGAPLPAAGD